MTRFTLFLATLVLSACATLMGPRTVDISREELLHQLSRQFPMHKQLAEVLDVEAATPRLTLLPDANRIGAQFDLAATDRLFGRRYQGIIGLSFGLRFEPQDLTIRLADVKVDTVQLDGLPAAAQRQLSRLGSWLAEDSLQNYPIHRFKPDDLRAADRMGYQVQDIRVTAQGLSIHLHPKP